MSEAQIMTLAISLFVIEVAVAVFAWIWRTQDERNAEEKRRAALQARIMYERNCVETALQIKLFEWQVEYIWGNSPVLLPGRGSGKTLAYVIKLCLSEGRPLYMYPGGLDQCLCDADQGPRYYQLFRAYVRETYQKLKRYRGLKLRNIYFSQKEVPHGD